MRRLARQLRIYQGDPEWDPSGRRSGAVMLLGAGCSRSAGIRLAGEIAQSLALELAARLGAKPEQCGCPDDAMNWLVDTDALAREPGDGPCDWGRRYGDIFGTLLTSDESQREVIQSEIAASRDQINWAHVCIGEMVNKHYVHTILTTNFDPLAVRGIILTGRLPVIADGIEALSRVVTKPATPQVVHIHGSMHSYSPRNSPFAVGSTSSELPMQGAMWGILKESDVLVVVGYAGKEEGVVELLLRAGRELPNLVVFWVTYDTDDTHLSEDLRRFLSGHNKHVIYDQDADAFFMELMRQLGERIGWIDDPLSPLEARRNQVARPPVEEVCLALDEYASRLNRMSIEARKSDPEFKLARAAMDSLSGMDERVVDELSAGDPTSDVRAERLLAGSLFRTGDAAQNLDRLRESVRLWRDQIARGESKDGVAYLRLGDVLQSLADLEERSSSDIDIAGRNRQEQARQDSIEAYEHALEAIDPENAEVPWREAREKYATAVIEFGDKGAELEKLDRAIAALRELLDAGPFEPQAAQRAEAYDKLSALYLMRAYRTGLRADFQEAVDAGERAVDVTRESSGSTTAAVMQRNLAAALRGLGEHRRKNAAEEEEGLDELRRAAGLYRAAAGAYLAGVRDADADAARAAALETLDEARDIFRAIGAEDEAQDAEGLLATLSSSGG